jgi:CO/xanthine dehydrogenase Mo-binding subunit
MARVIRTKTEFEGRFYEEMIVVEGEGLSAWPEGAALSYVGRETSRVDGAERVSGQAIYTADVHLPGMLWGKILRSPHPHARVKKIDVRKAEQRPGVWRILTPGNIPRVPFFGGLTPLLGETVRFAGEEIACVIAEDKDQAEDALEEISVEYEQLPFVLDPEEALQPGAPQIHASGNLIHGAPDVYDRGNLIRGFEEAEVIIEDVFRTSAVLHNCMESHGSVALWEGDRLTLWDSTQHIFGIRAQVAQLLNLPLNKVRVIKQYMGGGFGSKNNVGRYSLLAAVGSRMTGRPVKIILDRHEENLSTGNRPPGVQYLKIGARRNGALTAVHLRAYVTAGAYILYPPAVGGPVRQLYACPNVKTEQFNVFTNTGPLSAFRGPGYLEGTFALESIMDELAEKLGMDPLELRLMNYTEKNQITGQPYTTKGLKEAYERGAREFGWAGRAREKNGPKRRGFGMASQIWGGSGGPPAYAWVKINPDATVVVLSGTQDLGTGTRTVLAQIAAEEMRVPIDQVSVQIGDTQMTPYAPISAGSMTMPSVGPAVRIAASDARKQFLDIAAQVLQVPNEELEIQDGFLRSPKLDHPVPMKDVLAQLRNFMVMGRGARSPNPEGAHVNTFGVQFVEVEVEATTGEVTIKKLVAVHDSGRVINPLTLSSQIEGGVIQGLGHALTEKRILDQKTGLVLNANLEDYRVPTIQDAPTITLQMVDRPDPRANNLGSKGVGEPPIIPTAGAVSNAIADALQIRMKEIPITRANILEALSTEKK